MVRIYTLTLVPSLDSATITPQIYPEGKLRCTAPVFEPGGGGINVARAIAHLGGSATAIFPAGGATGEHLVSLLADENVPVATVEAKDWTRQNLHVHVEASGEQYRFVMPGAALSEDEFRQLEEQVLEIESGAILVISGSLPPCEAGKINPTDFRCAKTRDSLHRRQFWRSVKCSTGDW